jgi:hypothetical protein
MDLMCVDELMDRHGGESMEILQCYHTLYQGLTKADCLHETRPMPPLFSLKGGESQLSII